MDTHVLEQFAADPSCRKCAAKAPLNRPAYIYHESADRGPTGCILDEHIHLTCRRCNYKWLMAPAETTGTKWYDKAPLGRLLMPGMPSYQENTERFEEKDESPSHKVGWRKPEGLFDVD